MDIIRLAYILNFCTSNPIYRPVCNLTAFSVCFIGGLSYSLIKVSIIRLVDRRDGHPTY